MAAESLDDGEFWLPPKFLIDNDDIFTETAKTKTPSGLKNTKDLFGFDAPLFPLEFPYGFDSFRSGVGLAVGGGFSSDISSPVESVVGSTTETESSDEEDYLAGLTRQMGLLRTLISCATTSRSLPKAPMGDLFLDRRNRRPARLGVVAVVGRDQAKEAQMESPPAAFLHLRRLGICCLRLQGR